MPTYKADKSRTYHDAGRQTAGGMQDTPSSERLHIAVIGKRNSGKSSLVNAMTGQETSVVSNVPGTTTDPVRKAMEIPGIGPCLFIDTAGFDDDAGGIGQLRVSKTMQALERADIVLFVMKCPAEAIRNNGGATVAEMDASETELMQLLRTRNLPVIPVINIFQGAGMTIQDSQRTALPATVRTHDGTETEAIVADAYSGWNIQAIFGSILRHIPEGYGSRTITGGLVDEGDCIMLVMPQDIQAPKGRLILPQVQTLRELLDKKCQVVCCTADTMKKSLERMAAPPDLIITDSQVFQKVWALKPPASRLTSFSILFAGYKGDIAAFLAGARTLDRLGPDARILIAEACTHAPASEDIGRIKIPHMLRQRLGEGVDIDIVSGNDFPEDLTGYSLIIHCGACMFNRKYVLARIEAAEMQGVPVTNYGMTIAWAKGILNKVALP